MFNLIGGTRLVVLSDEQGIALVPAESFEEGLKQVLQYMSVRNDKDG